MLTVTHNRVPVQLKLEKVVYFENRRIGCTRRWTTGSF